MADDREIIAGVSMTDNDNNFSKRLSLLIEESGLTLRAVSEASNVPLTTIANWKTGTAPTDFDAVKRLAEVFDVSFSFMMLGYDEPTNNRAPRVEDALTDGGELFDGFCQVTIRRLVPRRGTK